NIDGKGMASAGVFTVILRGVAGPANPKAPPPKPGQLVVSQPSTPITLIIVPKQLAKLKTPANAGKLQPGKEIEIPVEVARLNDYDGPFKLELIVPPNVKGLRAAESEIKAGESGGKLVLRADQDAKIGAAPVLVVRAIAMFNGETPIVHESKVVVSLVK